MKTIYNIFVYFLIIFGFVLLTYITVSIRNSQDIKPIEWVEKEPPITNWSNFYERVFLVEWQVSLAVGMTTDDGTNCEYDLYLVDGNKWLKVESNKGFNGCGSPQSVNRFFVLINDDFINRLKMSGVPSDNAKFVVVGTHNVKIVEQKVRYYNRNTHKFEK